MIIDDYKKKKEDDEQRSLFSLLESKKDNENSLYTGTNNQINTPQKREEKAQKKRIKSEKKATVKIGSLKYQLNNILKNINGIGVSKKLSRETSTMRSLESGHRVSQLVHSYKSMENMRNDLLNLSNFSKENFELKDIRLIDKRMVDQWIKSKNIKYNTASNYLSEINKVQKYLSISQQDIKELRHEYKRQLDKTVLTTRSYSFDILNSVQLPIKSQIAFILQRDYGLRVSASTHINIDKQIKGNIFSFREKGGKISQKKLSLEIINSIKENSINGIYNINKRTYSRHLQKEIKNNGGRWNGTHGLRHSYAQNQMKKGRSKQEVSLSMGHVRTEITDTYLR
jgi:hypothetical protein